jgi:hypothetical protein
MPLARRAAAALFVMGAGVLAYAVPATATGTDHHHGNCVDGTNQDDYTWSFEGQESLPTGKAWIKVKDGRQLCTSQHIVLSIYKVPDTWDGLPFPGGNNSAVPQHVIAHATGTLDKNGHQKLYLQVPVPDCGNAQMDLYRAPKQDDVDTSGTARFIAGIIYSIGANGQAAPHGHPAPCTPPPPPTTTPPPPTTTTPPPPTTTPPPPTTTPPPPPTTTPPTTTTPPPTTTPPTTTEAPPITTIVPTTTAPPAAAPIPVLPQQPTRLAETGSNSTIPLLGLGSLLVASGIGLSLAGRRRRPTQA